MMRRLRAAWAAFTKPNTIQTKATFIKYEDMSPEAQKAFDEAFKKHDIAFEQMDKAFDSIRNSK